jgi:SAM-dependent methyltransferase
MGAMPEWVPETVDTTKPSAARMYDYYLGGAHNFGVDRELAGRVLALFPDGPMMAQANRSFLHRAVRTMLDAGVRQFLDVGSGIPTSGNVHEIAQQAVPGARVLYVDHDAVAVAHSELMLRGNPDAAVLHGDLRRPREILESPELRGLLDLSQPVGILLIAVLHFVSEDDRPAEILAELRDAVAPGSHLAVSHGTGVGRTTATMEQLAEIYRSTATPLTYRDHDQVRELFAGWDLLAPGVVWAPEWRPSWHDEVGDDPGFSGSVAAVGRRA